MKMRNPRLLQRRNPCQKREKLEALAKKKRHDESPPTKESTKKPKKKDKDPSGEQKDGYESEGSVDSAQIERTEEDDNFIDTTGEDEEAIKELLREATL